MKHQPPDAEEKVIRFGCGALFGLLTGLLALGLAAFGGWMNVAVLTALSLCCGWLAVRYGDSFWRKALKYIPWFW